MADTTNLERFLKDVADSIRAKKNVEGAIQAESFDEEIDGILTAPVAEKVVVEAKKIVEDEDVVKIDSAPIGEPVLVPETGITEVLTDKALLAENIGLTPDKIALGYTVLGVDGEAETGSGGGDTSDATATEDDILYPKTAYTADGKVRGTITAEYGITGKVKKKNPVNGNTSYYIFDYLPKLNIGLIGTSTSPGGVYLCQYDPVNNTWLTSNWLYIAKAPNNTCVVSVKFAGLPVINDPANGLYEYKFLMNGTNDGNYDHHYFRAGRIRIQINKENGLATFSLVQNFQTYQQHDWYTTGQTIYNICANPNSDNMFYYRILNSIRMGTHGIIKAVVYETSVGFAEQNSYGSNTQSNCWLQFSEDGGYVSWYINGTSHVGTIKTSNNSAAKGAIGMHSITKRGDAYYYFYNYNVYTLSGTKLTNYSSTVYNFSYSYCFWLGTKVLLFNGRYVLVVNFDDNWKMTIVQKYDLGDTAYSPTSYDWKHTKLGHASYREGSLICETYRGTLLVISQTEGNAIKTVTINGLTYSSGAECTATAANVIEGKTFIAQGREHTGTMKNNGALNYEPSINEQTIPYGFTSGGTIGAVTKDIDSNIIPENIKTGVTILGVEGTLEKVEGGSATQDANLIAKYLLEGYSAVVDDTLVEGAMINYGSVEMAWNSEVQEIPTGYYDELYVPLAVSSNLDGYNECSAALDVVMYGEPGGYTELNYIKSTGAQVIDTGIICKDTIKFQAKFSTAVHTGGCYFGGNGNGEPDAFRFFSFGEDPDARWYLDYGSGTIVDEETGTDTGNRIYGGIATLNTVYELEVGNRYIKNLATGSNVASNASVEFDDKTYTFRIFNGGSQMNLYYCKVYDGDELVRDLVPARKNDDLTICLYDKVTKQFFTNIGTDNFISGGVKK